MKRPAYQITSLGISLPVRHCPEVKHDGDTPVVAVADGVWKLIYTSTLGDQMTSEFDAGLFRWRVRLLGVDTPESNEPGGTEATRFTRTTLAGAEGHLSVWIPMRANLVAGGNPLSLASFSRVLGHIYINDTETLTDLLQKHGHVKQ